MYSHRWIGKCYDYFVVSGVAGACFDVQNNLIWLCSSDYVDQFYNPGHQAPHHIHRQLGIHRPSLPSVKSGACSACADMLQPSGLVAWRHFGFVVAWSLISDIRQQRKLTWLSSACFCYFCFVFCFVFVRYKASLTPCGKFGPPYLGTAAAAASEVLPIPTTVRSICVCVRAVVRLPSFKSFRAHTDIDTCRLGRLPSFKSFRAHTDIDTCRCTWWLHKNCNVTEPALGADSGRKVPCHTRESNLCHSVLRLDFQPDTLPPELSCP